MSGLKFAEEGVIEGLGIPFGSVDRRDAHGEWFSSATDLAEDWFAERPLIYHHGLSDAGTAVIGKFTTERRADGVWVRAVLDKASRWFSRVRDELARGILGFSSGSIPHLVKVAANGEIQRWPLVEMSLTPSPASRDAVIYSVRSADAFAHYTAAGLSPAGLKALVEAADTVDLRAERERFEREQLRTMRDQFYARTTR